MKIFRNEKRGELTAEYRRAMNTSKRLRILKEEYQTWHNREIPSDMKNLSHKYRMEFGYETEEEYIKRRSKDHIIDTKCPKILECFNV